jgi:hypothetical protein
MALYLFNAFVVSIVIVFGFAVGFKIILNKTKIRIPTKKSLILILTIKNSIFAATAGLSLVNNIAAIPGLILSVVIIFYLMVIEKIVN